MRQILVIGASGGIGNKVAEVILAQGYSVIGTYYQHPERVEKLSKKDNFRSVSLDLKNIDSIRSLKKVIKDNNKLIYAIINCAGIVRFEGENLEKDINIWKETIAVNLSGNYLLAKYLYGYIEENGRFIMISSTDSYYGGAVIASYATSKSGVNSLTKSLSLLFKEKKIRVNSIAPGWVVTPMIEANGGKFLDKVASINPLGRNAKPIDVANLINFLLSDASDYINGQVIPLEGGYTNQDLTLLLEEDIKQ